MLQTRLIMTVGLTDEEIDIIKKNVPQKECEVINTDDIRDIFAMHEFVVIAKTDVMETDEVDILLDFYSEIVPFGETVIFIGKVQVPEKLSKYIVVYEDFDELKDKIKYVLLTAYRKQKKTENFSVTLANAIMILSMIRKHPYITSAELAERLELSQRSIQRYIETLRVAGEWIEYSTEKRGWMLSAGKSVLWGDF